MWRQSKSLARGVRRRARRHWKSLAYAALAAGAVVLAAWLVLYVLPPTLASDKTTDTDARTALIQVVAGLVLTGRSVLHRQNPSAEPPGADHRSLHQGHRATRRRQARCAPGRDLCLGAHRPRLGRRSPHHHGGAHRLRARAQPKGRAGRGRSAPRGRRSLDRDFARAAPPKSSRCTKSSTCRGLRGRRRPRHRPRRRPTRPRRSGPRLQPCANSSSKTTTSLCSSTQRSTASKTQTSAVAPGSSPSPEQRQGCYPTSGGSHEQGRGPIRSPRIMRWQEVGGRVRGAGTRRVGCGRRRVGYRSCRARRRGSRRRCVLIRWRR